jgi:hypothetical protein
MADWRERSKVPRIHKEDEVILKAARSSERLYPPRKYIEILEAFWTERFELRPSQLSGVHCLGVFNKEVVIRKDDVICRGSKMWMSSVS